MKDRLKCQISFLIKYRIQQQTQPQHAQLYSAGVPVLILYLPDLG